MFCKSRFKSVPEEFLAEDSKNVDSKKEKARERYIWYLIMQDRPDLMAAYSRYVTLKNRLNTQQLTMRKLKLMILRIYWGGLTKSSLILIHLFQ